MDKLNKSKPHDIVYGVPGVGFVQEGQSFDPGGKPVRTVRAKVWSDKPGVLEEIDMAVEEVERLAVPEKEEPVEEKEDVSVPDFIKDVPKPLKHPLQMKAIECMAELRKKGVPFEKGTKVDDLRKLVIANR